MKTISEVLNPTKVNEGVSNMKLWETIDELKETLGADKLVDELCQSMSDDELEKNLKFICKNYEVKFNH